MTERTGPKFKPAPIYTRRGNTVYQNGTHYFSVLTEDMGDLEENDLLTHIVHLLNNAAGT